MGISIQSYRATIGLFSNSKPGKVRKIVGSKSKSRQPTRRINIIQVLLLLSTFLNVGTPETHNRNNNRYPVTYQVLPNNFSPIIPISKNTEVQCHKQEILNINFLGRYKYGNKRNSGIKLCHWNKGSAYLENKKDELETIIGGYQPHVFGVSEANFKSQHDRENVEIEHYNIYFSKTLDNPTIYCSRIAVYIHEDIQAKLRDDLMNDTFSSVWLELGLPRQRKFLVCQVYRDWQYLDQPDNSSLDINQQLTRWLQFLDQWERALLQGKEVIVMGDMNLDFLKWCRNVPVTSQAYRMRPLVESLFSKILPHGVIQCVTEPTRQWPGQESAGLDHIYTNKPDKLSEIQTIYQGGSDHKMLFVRRYTKAQISKPRICKKRSYKNFDQTKFLAAVRSIPFWEVYSCQDVNTAVEILTFYLTNILDQMAPIKTIQIRKKYCPWLSAETKTLMENRNDAQRRFDLTKDPIDWGQYKKLRNKVNNRLRCEKINWQKNKLESIDNKDTGQTWKNVKGWLGWASGGPPTKLYSDGVLHSKPSALSSVMNNFFVSKVKNLIKDLPANPADPLLLVKKLMQNRECTFSLGPVYPEMIEKIIKKMKTTKTVGIDNIDSYVVKLASAELLPSITHIVNLSIKQKVFPEKWKRAKVVPLHKKEDKTVPKNYRPVALLSVLSKILEKAVFLQTIQYLEENDLLHPSHHGFRSNHNTCTALLQMYDTWIDAFEEDLITAVIMIDMSAAFDVVNHSILIEKLKIYGFQENVIDWITSYLSNRTQQVYIEGNLSPPLQLEAGVPQGSILGPLLYILFTNCLPEVIHDHEDIIQADPQPIQADPVSIKYNTNCDKC